MKRIRFTSTRLVQSGKKGIFKPDENGYYEMPVGGLNAYNGAGEYYTLEGAIDLFESSSVLMRRLQKGYLKAEQGHPKPSPGMTDDQYLERILRIEETNWCAHFSELWLDHEFGAKNPQFKNPKLVAIMAKLKPTGIHGPALESALNDPHENVGFSIRGLTQNFFEKGRTYRVLTSIVTFDRVTEQGIGIANKWDAPSLESLDCSVNEHQLRRIAENRSSVALESSRETATEALRSIAVSNLPVIPIYKDW